MYIEKKIMQIISFLLIHANIATYMQLQSDFDKVHYNPPMTEDAQ